VDRLGNGTIWDLVVGAGPVTGPITSAMVDARNVVGLPAARVIDANPVLSGAFGALAVPADVSNAVNQTLPLLVGGTQFATIAALSGVQRIVQSRIGLQRGLSSGDEYAGDRHFWVKPYGTWADQSERNGVSGFAVKATGIALGSDRPLSERTRLGVAFSYARAGIDGDAPAVPNTATTAVGMLMGYGSHVLADDVELSFQAGFGQTRNHGRRTIVFTNQVAESSYDGMVALVGVGVGTRVQWTERTTLAPSMRADYTWVREDGYRETGAGALNLSVQGRAAEQWIVGPDIRINHMLADTLVFTGDAGLGYDVINQTAQITSAFAGAPGAVFVTRGLSPAPWVTRAGLGITKITTRGWEIYARYDVEHRATFLNQTASARFRYLF
jgi:autotransporter family porin